MTQSTKERSEAKWLWLKGSQPQSKNGEERRQPRRRQRTQGEENHEEHEGGSDFRLGILCGLATTLLAGLSPGGPSSRRLFSGEEGHSSAPTGATLPFDQRQIRVLCPPARHATQSQPRPKKRRAGNRIRNPVPPSMPFESSGVFFLSNGLRIDLLSGMH
jgi:hypothetical protein